MQFNLSSYIRILKTNSKSASTSDESFVSELFDPFVVALGLKNKFGKELKLIAEGKLDTEPLITHTYPLSKIDESYELFENKRDGVIKIAVECSI